MSAPTTEWVREQVAIARRTDPNPGALERIALPLAEERDRLERELRDDSRAWQARAEAAERDRDEAQRVLVEWHVCENVVTAGSAGMARKRAEEYAAKLAADPEVRRRIERKEDR